MRRKFRDLFEIFDAPHPYEKFASPTKKSPWHEYKFDHKDSTFKVAISKSYRGGVDVGFANHNDEDRMTGLHPRDAHKIVGTVKHIVANHVSGDPSVKHMYFNARQSEKGKVKLYRSIADRHGGDEGVDDDGNHIWRIPVKRPK